MGRADHHPAADDRTPEKTVNQSWNASLTSQGATVAARNVDYKGRLAAGASTRIGFIGSWIGTNTLRRWLHRVLIEPVHRVPGFGLRRQLWTDPGTPACRDCSPRWAMKTIQIRATPQARRLLDVSRDGHRWASRPRLRSAG
ncbi:cellulose binding domain-containing protein [Micromonospora sp. LOL_028]|uniref:cellulose binding domain-containing protein n=1 Tax=Micromonospora sp. LOL_028 TaxID=3345420 RepID=UPI003A86731F